MSETVFDADTPRALATPRPEISLWWCTLEAPPGRVAHFEPWLSPAERVRRERFGNDALRLRYVVGRATLRWLLSRALDVAPADIVIGRGTRGRPYLPDVPALDFNVTHTGLRAMIGIAQGVRLGVDIEHGERRLNALGVARKFMTPAERAALPTDADAARRRLLRLWTCKEAMSKATGDALSAPFGQIEIDAASDLHLAAGPAPYTPGQWSLHTIDAPDDHLATVALWHAAPKNAAATRA